MTFPSEQVHFDAIKTVLSAADARPYDYGDKVPSNIKAYTLLTVSDRFGGVLRMTGQIGTRGARISVRSVGSTAENVREMRRRAAAALREQVLAVGDYKTTPVAFETAEPVGQDGDIRAGSDWYSALTTYTYTI